MIWCIRTSLTSVHDWPSPLKPTGHGPHWNTPSSVLRQSTPSKHGLERHPSIKNKGLHKLYRYLEIYVRRFKLDHQHVLILPYTMNNIESCMRQNFEAFIASFLSCFSTGYPFRGIYHHVWFNKQYTFNINSWMMTRMWSFISNAKLKGQILREIIESLM